MKKFFIFIMSAASIILLIALWQNVLFRSESSKVKLCINDNEVVNENIKLYYREHGSYADLPFIALLERLGFNVEWKDNSLAYISGKYVLDLNTVSLYKLGDNIDDNWLDPLIGGSCTRIVLHKEIILDSFTMIDAIEDMGMDIDIDFDFDKSIVYITNKNN